MKKWNLKGRSFKCIFSSPFKMKYAERNSSFVDGESNSGQTEPAFKPVQKPNWRFFSYEEIHKATNGFHQDNLVGSGGYAEVYKGELESGQVVAVKRLTRASTDEQKEKEFLTELGVIGHVNHPNVIPLFGFSTDQNLHLIFDFSSQGSVSSNLHGENSELMGWKLRRKIAVGTARGLHYLQKDCQRRIIHRDIKTSNVLLSANFEPLISDFGLARWLPSEWSHRAVAPIEGTFGCLAPEYFTHGIVDEKTDVFAFGVFLLEIISGRKPVDGSHKSLLSWAKPYLKEGKIEMLVDPRLGEDYDIDQLKRLTFTASLCIRLDATLRPSMKEVLELIEKAKISTEQWRMTEEEEDDEFWALDDLEDDCDTTISFSSSSLISSISSS
ncbi:probable receptor-like serine/threonine-protein kinase At5g57670 [Dendrobium catenatum]|uniref:Putative receptor-like serine/threonine-protein kinase n=1 Tax=Dendrobium catenatum TaxID=906689 RepID=A0A2I0W1P1_9ASPA|nr:probable receptor-like serine/threonine-protein kinase At5g57670 [Dendrobium catenatum]PKU69584.1 putative receptor-like serine/threonine-protein kinase [Dendrobium catenatum]